MILNIAIYIPTTQAYKSGPISTHQRFAGGPIQVRDGMLDEQFIIGLDNQNFLA